MTDAKLIKQGNKKYLIIKESNIKYEITNKNILASIKAVKTPEGNYYFSDIDDIKLLSSDYPECFI